MALHIGNNRTIPRSDIVAVLDVKTLRRAHGMLAPDDSEMNLDSARSVIVLESGGRTKLCASPISTAALRLRSLL